MNTGSRQESGRYHHCHIIEDLKEDKLETEGFALST